MNKVTALILTPLLLRAAGSRAQPGHKPQCLPDQARSDDDGVHISPPRRNHELCNDSELGATKT